MQQPVFQRIAVRMAALGEGFTAARALPTRERRMVGAWCFLDHLGPVQFSGEEGMHVGEHPHTALQTFTWMIEGNILHRDSLGSEQVIRPGQVNLMTAGWGIAHTEDSLPGESALHAVQLWIALPAEKANIEPSFEHHPVLPAWKQDGVACTLLAGHYADRDAPSRVHTPLFGLELYSETPARTTLSLTPEFEYALLPLTGSVQIGAESVQSNELAYLGQGRSELELRMEPGSRVLLLGGQPYPGTVSMWWNFVGATRDDVTKAQLDWEAGASRFGPVKGGEGRRLEAPKLPWLQR